MNVEPVFFAVEKNKVLARGFDIAGFAVIDRIAGSSDPVADSRKKFCLKGKDLTLCGRTDVEKIVCADFSASAEVFDKFGKRLFF